MLWKLSRIISLIVNWVQRFQSELTAIFFPKTHSLLLAFNEHIGTSHNKRFQQMTKMIFQKIAWWFPRNFEALNTILGSKTTYDQYLGPLPAPERAFLAPLMHIWPFNAYNSRTKAWTMKWVVPFSRSHSVDAKTCINFCVLTNICWFNAIWTWLVLAGSAFYSRKGRFWSVFQKKII